MSKLAQPRPETIQARRMFLAGHTLAEISKATNLTWTQSRCHGDPDGEWRTVPKPKRCSICLKIKQPSEMAVNNSNPDRLSSRCALCSRTYFSRRAVRARYDIEPKVIKEPDTKWGCPVCGVQRTKKGRWFMSQDDADKCCVCPKCKRNYNACDCHPGIFLNRDTDNKAPTEYKYTMPKGKPFQIYA